MKLARLFIIFFIMALPAFTTACGGGNAKDAESAKVAGRISFLASAPDGFSIRHLGRPYNADFDLLPGVAGKSLFPESSTHVSRQHRLTTQFVEIKDDESFAAHASAWGVVDAGTTIRSDHRYVSRRLLQVHDVIELDETTGIADAAPDAVYYPWRVHRGWSYEVVCDGRSSHFEASFKATFLVAQGGLESFAEEHKIDCRALGRGLTIHGTKSVFATNIDELKERFKTSTQPVPVAVEWRRIPGRSGHTSKVKLPKKGCAGEVGCEPCEKWSFERFEWQLPRTKANSNEWDGDGSPPDVQVTIKMRGGAVLSSPKFETYDFDWKFDAPLIIGSSEFLQIVGTDRDFSADDHIVSYQLTIPKLLADGIWKVGNGQAKLKGQCIIPKSSLRSDHDG